GSPAVPSAQNVSQRGGSSLVLYLIPRTAVLGALLWTGYPGGAVAPPSRGQSLAHPRPPSRPRGPFRLGRTLAPGRADPRPRPPAHASGEARGVGRSPAYSARPQSRFPWAVW